MSQQIAAKAQRLLPVGFRAFASWRSPHDDAIVLRVRREDRLFVNVMVRYEDHAMEDAMFSNRFIEPILSAFERLDQ